MTGTLLGFVGGALTVILAGGITGAITGGLVAGEGHRVPVSQPVEPPAP